MKKILALLLALGLLASLTPAFATESEALDVKLSKQLVNGSGFKVTLSFEPGSALPLDADSQDSPLLAQGMLVAQSLLLRSTLQAEYLKTALAAQKSKEDLNISLHMGDAPAASFRYRSDGTLEAFTSSLLGNKEYAAATGESFFMGLLSGGASQWPGLERVLYAVFTADNEWRTAAQALSAPYTNELSVWMQKYTDIKTVTAADGSVSTTTTLIIPAAEVKTQAKALLTRFFADEQLLTLLKEKMTAREAAVYLNPAMLGNFLTAVDNLPLDRDVVITRVFGKDGLLMLDDILLPMAGANGLAEAHYVMTVLEDASAKTQLKVTKADGSLLDVSVIAADSQVPTYAGTLTLTPAPLPAAIAPATAAPESAPESYAFTLEYNLGDTIYDRLQDRYTANHTAKATITPNGGQTHTLEANITMDSGNNRSSATNVNGTLTWTRQGSDNKLVANITGGSTAPWSIPAVGAANALRLDSMTPEELAEVTKQWQTDIQAALAQMMTSLLPQTTP